jgi:hypothetical protein
MNNLICEARSYYGKTMSRGTGFFVAERKIHLLSILIGELLREGLAILSKLSGTYNKNNAGETEC